MSITRKYLLGLAAASLSAAPLIAARAADDPPAGVTTKVAADARAVGTAVKRDAKVVADAAKDGAHQVAVAAKQVAHQVAAATKEGAEQVSAAAKRGAAKTKAAVTGDKTHKTGGKPAAAPTIKPDT